MTEGGGAGPQRQKKKYPVRIYVSGGKASSKNQTQHAEHSQHRNLG